jgi:hypothetical protein
LKKLEYNGYVKILYVEPERDLNTGLKELKPDSDCMSMAKNVLSTLMKQVKLYVLHRYNESNGIEVTSNDPDYVPAANEIEYDDNSTSGYEASVEDKLNDSADDGEHDDYFEFDEDPVGTQNQEQILEVQSMDKSKSIIEGEISDGYESEYLDSMDGSDDGEQSKQSTHKNMFNPAEMCMEYKWQVGTEFLSLNQFKDAMKEWALLNGRDIRYVKNDKLRCRMKCNGESCEWMAFVSKVGCEETYRLKTYPGDHTCGRTFKGYLASSSWVAEKLSTNMKMGESKKLAHVIEDVKEKYMPIFQLLRHIGQEERHSRN